MIKPPKLQKGDTIGVVATSRWIDPKHINTAAKNIEARGYKVKIHPNNGLRLHEWAGSFKERALALEEYWRDTNIKAIFTAGGGTRTLHLLDFINFDLLKMTPKIFMGYSDNTAIINALNTICGQIAYHGPDMKRFASDKAGTYLDQTFALLEGKKTDYDFSHSKVIRYGEGEGQLLGGNLCIFNYLLGTKYCGDLTGKIVIIEDEMEELRNIDRMLLHLRRVGHLDKAAGLIVGGFTMTLNGGSQAFPYTIEDLITEHTEGLKIPVIMDAPFGHGESLMTLPIGAKAKLSTKGGQTKFALV